VDDFFFFLFLGWSWLLVGIMAGVDFIPNPAYISYLSIVEEVPCRETPRITLSLDKSSYRWKLEKDMFEQ
jgi:ACT domain-containing protein